jgi:5-methylcytosine-specific restriction endonuclease McrA
MARTSPGWKAPPGWRKIRLQVFAVKGRRCYRCGAYATTVDHAIPVVLGGTHDLSNLRPACSPCNSSTGASMGNRLGPPRGNRRRGQRRAVSKQQASSTAVTVAAASSSPLRTSRQW